MKKTKILLDILDNTFFNDFFLFHYICRCHTKYNFAKSYSIWLISFFVSNKKSYILTIMYDFNMYDDNNFNHFNHVRKCTELCYGDRHIIGSFTYFSLKTLMINRQIYLKSVIFQVINDNYWITDFFCSVAISDLCACFVS